MTTHCALRFRYAVFVSLTRHMVSKHTVCVHSLCCVAVKGRQKIAKLKKKQLHTLLLSLNRGRTFKNHNPLTEVSKKNCYLDRLSLDGKGFS